jgi:signal transduction histidine kinase/CheY-like chemotaxis protein
MKLQSKTTLIVVLVFLVMGFGITSLFDTVIMARFATLEQHQTQQTIARVEQAFHQEVKSLQERVIDWAKLDEMYKFLKESDYSFIENNVNYQLLEPLGFHHFGIVRPDMTLAYGVQIVRDNETTIPLSNEVSSALLSSQMIRDTLNGNTLGGFVKFEGRLFIISSSYITNESGEAKPSGVFFVTREITRPLIEKLAHITNVDLKTTQISATSHGNTSAPFLDFKRSFSSSLKKIDRDLIVGSSIIHDIFNEKMIELVMTFNRDIYQQGLAIKEFFSQMIVLIGISASASILLLIRIFAIRPIKELITQLAKITDDKDFSARVKLRAQDEMGTLGEQINDTLNTVESSLCKAETAQHQAEAANAAKSSFIAKVSHELRTPIHSITGMLRILLKEERSSSKRNYIVMARNSAYGLLETINEILDFSKAEAGKISIERIEFSLHEVIREAIQTIGARVEEKGSLETVLEIAQGIPSKVYGDPLRLRQVLVNLLGNATKFTKEGHIGLSVRVTSSESERVGLELTVFDTGVGIPADRLDHIFEPFGQADESVSRMFTGTGLGLTIVKQFVEAMGGSVSVESTVGLGSRFIINIQLENCRDAIPISYKPLLASQQVALLDDNSLVVERFSQELEENGYIPVIVNCDDPRELNEVTKSLSQFGLIIVTSEALKRSRVFDLVVELRGRESVPVISILSPYEISVRERLVALEVPFVVTRPISLLDILGVISGEVSLNDDCWQDSDDASLSSSRPLEILIADDAQTNRIILTELLRDAGHHVVCVENGVDMVSRVRDSLEALPGNRSFDLILTDVQMPLLDGLTATSRIRDMERDKKVSTHLPIVAVTAHAMTEEVSRMRQFGVDDVVTKPLDPIKLGAVIQKLTGQATNSRERSNIIPTPKQITEADLSQMSLRLWTQIAKRDDSLIELFGLSEDPMSPEDFQRVLDIEDVLERSGNSIRRTLLIFGGFLECFREQLQKINEAKQSRDIDSLRFSSHALKGLLLDVGARASGSLASSIEKHCKNGESEQALGLVNQLIKQILLVSRLVLQIHTTASGEGQKNIDMNALAPDSASDLGESDSEPT